MKEKRMFFYVFVITLPYVEHFKKKCNYIILQMFALIFSAVGKFAEN